MLSSASPGLPLRILIVHPMLWAHYKAAVFSELHQLAQQRADATIWVVQLAKTERSRVNLGDPTQGGHPYPHRLLFDRPLEDIGIVERFRALLGEVRRFRPQVVNLTGYFDPAQIGILIYCRLKGIALVLSNESNSHDQQRQGWKEAIKRLIIRQFDGFICFGSPSAQYMIQLGARPDQILTQRAAVVNDSVLRARFEEVLPLRAESLKARKMAPHNFIYVGRMLEVKNLQRLVSAFVKAQLQPSKGAEWGLILLGEGPLKASLQAYVAEHQIQNVQFMPSVDWHRVPDALALADALVLPSYLEPWGLVVNEAMVCGLPVVVSSQCGCAFDLVQDGKNGFVFDAFDELQLARCLQNLMEASAQKRLEMGKASLQIVQEFSLSRAAADMMAGFKKVAAENSN